MADPTLFTKHVSQGLGRLLAQFQGQPNFAGVLSSLLTQVQEIEVMFIALINERYLSTAVGAQLDGIGRVVGELRLGRSDTDYRAVLSGRIRANRANGRVEDIHALFTILLPGFSFTWTQSAGPAAFSYEIDQALTASDPSAAVLDAQLQVAKGAGIGASLVYGEQPLANSFTFADGDTLQADTLLGYSNDAGTSGGYYRDVAS